MYLRVTATPNSPRKSVKVVESIREGLKVKQVMLHHVGVAATPEEIEKLQQLGKRFIVEEQRRREQQSNQLSLFDAASLDTRLEALEKPSIKRGRKPRVQLATVSAEDKVSLIDLVEEQRVVEGLHEIAGHVYEQMGYNHLLKSAKDKELLKDIVLMRLAEPSSKLKSQQILQKRFAKLHDLDAIYRLMDKIAVKISDIKAQTFEKTKQLLPETVDLLFFDCTTLYFESTNTDELRAFGYSKDHRFNTTQVVLALATNKDGLPIGYELFEGNKAEVGTLLQALNSWKSFLKIERVCFVADRAMMSQENLTQLEASGHQYVIAAKLRSLPHALMNSILSKNQSAAADELKDWIEEYTHQERRLIVSYKTLRAARDAKQRDSIVSKIKKQIGEAGPTQKLISNQGVKKYTRTADAKTTLDHSKLEQDALWDGLHGVITNIKEEAATSLLERYARLWKIEESFRINKHTLSMRPIYHFKPERIKAHIALCYMAFSVLRHMEYTVMLTQKMSINTVLDELMHVQASYYRHTPTQKLYRMPGSFSHKASKIYKAFQVQRNNHAQVAQS